MAVHMIMIMSAMMLMVMLMIMLMVMLMIMLMIMVMTMAVLSMAMLVSMPACFAVYFAWQRQTASAFCAHLKTPLITERNILNDDIVRANTFANQAACRQDQRQRSSRR